MATDNATKGFKTFSVIWLGQIVSLLGSAMTNFALGVWIFTETRSVTQFAIVVVIAGLPGILVAPLAGAFVDRWNRRHVLMGTDLGAALVTLAIALPIKATMGWRIPTDDEVTSIDQAVHSENGYEILAGRA